MPKSDAVLFALALHLADFIPIFVMGSFFLRSEKVTIDEIKKEGAEEEILDRMAAPELAADEDRK